MFNSIVFVERWILQMVLILPKGGYSEEKVIKNCDLSLFIFQFDEKL